MSAAWAAVVSALLACIAGGVGKLNWTLGRLVEHMNNHDKWHAERIARGADAP